MTEKETLTLYYYDDGLDASTRAEISRKLERDPEFAERYRRLRRSLDALRDVPETPASASAVQTWRDAFDALVREEQLPAATPASMPRFQWAVAATVLLAIGVVSAVFLLHEPAVQGTVAGRPVQQIPATSMPLPAYTRSLAVHMQQSRQQLQTLNGADAAVRARLIAEIIEQNRLFERAAEANGAADLARVLRAFEQPLVALARSEATPQDIAERREQLSFELQVMLTKLSRQPSESAVSL